MPFDHERLDIEKKETLRKQRKSMNASEQTKVVNKQIGDSISNPDKGDDTSDLRDYNTLDSDDIDTSFDHGNNNNEDN